MKADSALVKIPELSFEIPPNTQRGVVTTVEGLLSRAVSGLLKEQTNRKVMTFSSVIIAEVFGGWLLIIVFNYIIILILQLCLCAFVRPPGKYHRKQFDLCQKTRLLCSSEL